jgi:hypothetical protein
MRVENFIVMMEQIPLVLGQMNMVHSHPKKLPMMKNEQLCHEKMVIVRYD